MLCGQTEIMTTNEFMDAFATAVPGERIVYALGDLAYACRGPGIDPQHRDEADAIRVLTFSLYAKGDGFLTQRKRHDVSVLGLTGFEYIFTKGSRA